MNDLANLAQQAVTLFQQNQHWLLDKAGGAVVALPVRELWEAVKQKLGSSSTEKIEQHAGDAGQWELFRSKLLVALDEDADFRSRIESLTKEAGISQVAKGDNNKQIVVRGSHNVNISS
jgi:hypothetical protein